MELMRKRDLVPTEVTWNSLVKGYALMQDISGTVDALARMEGEGFDADVYTTSTLKKIKDGEGLIKAWKEARGEGGDEGGMDGGYGENSELNGGYGEEVGQEGYYGEEGEDALDGVENDPAKAGENDGPYKTTERVRIDDDDDGDDDPSFPHSPTGGVL